MEKPLALNNEELNLIKETYFLAQNNGTELILGPQLMVGFNRRFSPHVLKMKQLLSTVNAPKSILITVNAGHIPAEHWTQDPIKGGGRIIGECCHYIDLIRHLTDSKFTSISGQSMTSGSSKIIAEDRSTITFTCDDGSIATILYLSNGSQEYPKERVEVFCEGTVLQLDNYIKLRGFGWKKFKKMNLWSQDKGIKNCVEAFIESINTGSPCIPIDEIFEVAKATIDAKDILYKN